MGDAVLDEALAAFMQGPVMMIFATRDARGLPAAGRSAGARVAPDRRRVDLFVPTRQWGQALDGLSPGDAVALTFCRPTNYRTFQVKGPVLALGPADAEDEAYAQAYVAMMRRELGELGITDGQSPHWLTAEALARVTFAPNAAFTQTPGPEAGRPLAEGRI